MSGIVTNNLHDAGGRTRYGIAEHYHPELTDTGFFTTMSNADALKIAFDCYDKEYGAALFIGALNSQKIANALLSFAINEGVKTSLKVLQGALRLQQDGVMGVVTMRTLNGLDESSALSLLAEKQAQHYRDIVAANPNDARFLNGWLNRVNQDCAR